jgi:hypothetical protein
VFPDVPAQAPHAGRHANDLQRRLPLRAKRRAQIARDDRNITTSTYSQVFADRLARGRASKVIEPRSTILHATVRVDVNIIGRRQRVKGTDVVLSQRAAASLLAREDIVDEYR